MNLYELSKEVALIEDEFDASESPDPGLLDRLDEIYPVAEQKFVACNHWLRNTEAYVDALDIEIKRLQARKKSLQNKTKFIRTFILRCMQLLSVDKFKTPEFTFSRTKPRASLEVDESRTWEWTPEFMEAAKRAGAIEEKIVINKTNLKLVPGYLDQPGVCEVLGEEGLTIR